MSSFYDRIIISSHDLIKNDIVQVFLIFSTLSSGIKNAYKKHRQDLNKIAISFIATTITGMFGDLAYKENKCNKIKETLCNNPECEGLNIQIRSLKVDPIIIIS